uniref:Uncharacterized protein n=1 Tax=Rhizochromulina marina TaxID=1034831 RepID=A0A7S2STA2_9STRA|mmetsp:Transcript_6028/g.17610  ORF Transcript_6028/g.17610 Transcript_6028/m.17610 type:complete len:103 (+) Transcript_6028:2-310(+)
MDDVWISGSLARRKVPRFVVPFDENQFNLSPHLKDVTTLDSISLQAPSGDKRGSNTPYARATASTPNARATANQQALRHFQHDWDVKWDGNNHKLCSADSGC